MPKKNTELVAADTARIAAHWNRLIGDRCCEVCGSEKWMANTYLEAIAVFDFALKRPSPVTFVPYASVYCQKCGKITQFRYDKLSLESMEHDYSEEEKETKGKDKTE